MMVWSINFLDWILSPSLSPLPTKPFKAWKIWKYDVYKENKKKNREKKKDEQIFPDLTFTVTEQNHLDISLAGSLPLRI